MEINIFLLSIIFFCLLYIHHNLAILYIRNNPAIFSLSRYNYMHYNYICNYYQFTLHINFNFINILFTLIYFIELIYFKTKYFIIFMFNYKLIYFIGNLITYNTCILNIITFIMIYTITFIMIYILLFVIKKHIFNIIGALFIIFIDFNYIRIRILE
jgi:hypothetical protein